MESAHTLDSGWKQRQTDIAQRTIYPSVPLHSSWDRLLFFIRLKIQYMPKLPPMDGQYNVPADPNEPYTYYQSVPKLPPQKSFYRESNELASVLRNEIADFLSRHCIPEFNEILSPVFGNYAIGESPSDRTMCFNIGDLNAFVPELVLTLQKRVLTRYPLWRLVAQFEELAIGVYPDGVWFDDNIVMGSFTSDHPVYRAWFDKAREYRESRFGALARQLDFACRKIPEAIVNMADNPYCLSRSDIDAGSRGRTTVRLLQEYSWVGTGLARKELQDYLHAIGKFLTAIPIFFANGYSHQR
ncbi:MAG: hypothetical protein LW870_22225 [Pirellula sp.]|nr:hypothetical protein [Pirellula sp.]